MTAVWLLITLTGVVALVAAEVWYAHRVANKRTRGTPKVITRLGYAELEKQWYKAQQESDYDGPDELDYNAETAQERLDRARDMKEGR